VGKLSGAVGTYSNVDPYVEQHVCARLGLAPVPATQVLARDRHAQLLYTAASIAASIESFALEVRHLQRTEVREVLEPFRTGQQKGSSAMPHKRNPIKAEQLCGLARVVRSNLQAGLEDVALWHERDISHSSVERIILPDSLVLTHYMVGQMRRIVEGMTIDEARMRVNLESSFGLVFSQPVLLALVEAGLTRDEAYRIVQANAMRAWEEHVPFRTLLDADPAVTGRVRAEQLDTAFDLTRSIANAHRTVDALDTLDRVDAHHEVAAPRPDGPLAAATR
jgi:adenylosuccinate lyase